MLVAMPEPLKSADDVLRDAFAALGCERMGGASVQGWSKQSDFQRCAYRYFLKHEQHLVPRIMGASSKAQDVGSFIHALLAVHYAGMLPAPVELEGGGVQVYPGWQANMPTPEALLVAMRDAGAEAMALQETIRIWDGYRDRWADDGWYPVGVEMGAGDPAFHTSRYDLVMLVEDDIHDGYWIGEHKSAHPATDFEQWDMHGEVLGEMLSWRLSNLSALFGDELRGVCINIIIKGKVTTYRRIWLPVNERLVREFERNRAHWLKMEEVYRRSGFWPRSFYGCQGKFSAAYDRCGFWDHCVLLDPVLLMPAKER